MKPVLIVLLALAGCAPILAPRDYHAPAEASPAAAEQVLPPGQGACVLTCAVGYDQVMPAAHLAADGSCACMPEPR